MWKRNLLSCRCVENNWNMQKEARKNIYIVIGRNSFQETAMSHFLKKNNKIFSFVTVV